MPRFSPFDPLERAVSALVRRDPELRAAFGSLAGIVLAIEVTSPAGRLALRFHEHGLDLLSGRDAEAHVTLRGSVPALIAMLEAARAGEVATGDVRVTGDMEALGAVREVLATLDLDGEEYLSWLIGDAGAHALGRVARSARRWHRRALHTLVLDTAEYLQEEASLTPGRAEVQRFVQEVDVLRDDVERIAQRVRRLARRARTC